MNRLYEILIIIMILLSIAYFSQSIISHTKTNNKIEKLENVNSDNINKVNNLGTSNYDMSTYKPKMFNETDIKILNKVFPSLTIMKKEDQLTIDQINKSNEPITIIPKNTFLGLNDVIDDNMWMLPWDREVGHCEILKDNDRDLYKTVQDVKTLTIY